MTKLLTTAMETERDVAVKENVVRALPLAPGWLHAALAAAAALAALAACADSALPAHRPHAPHAPHQPAPAAFHAHAAYRHLLNLTAVGPRVAGSYENEVVAVGVLVAAIKEVARAAAPHHRVEFDVFTADGAFPIAFLDGMNNIYRGVSGVVARVSAAAPRTPRAPRAALLFNCHYDTVPDSPGAADDAGGCAVLLEVLRALAAGARALRHDALFLFNGAEESILLAAHGFVTTHRWAGDARAFVNLEAMGAGGRELVFQAGRGRRAALLLDAYAAAAPRPFASSLAHELFGAGLIPADTDFRVFRDFARLPGLDLAWSADGYVYHTRLDAPDRVPPAALQRAGDNVLALALEVLQSEWLGRADDDGAEEEGQPVFFDVLGVWMVTLRPRAAAAAALLVLALVALDLRRAAAHARADLYMSGGAWWRAVAGAAAAVAGAAACGVAAAAGVALALAAADRRLAYYARPWLLAPLFALPALAAASAALRRLLALAGAPRGWWRARVAAAAGGALAAAALAACAALGLRAGYLPALAAAGAGAAGAAGPRRTGGARAALAALGGAPAALAACYLGAGTLRVLVPLAGRAGGGGWVDAALGGAAGALALAGAAWLLPLAAAARSTRAAERAAWLCCGAALALVAWQAPGAAYSARAPQRLMVFHARVTEHAPRTLAPRAPALQYWVPALDDNTLRSLHTYGLGAARAVSEAACARRVWCGAPYYLPALSLVRRWLAAPAPAPPRVALAANVTLRRHAGGARVLLRLAGARLAVVLAAPARGVRLLAAPPLRAPPQPSARWRGRPTYFFALHDARAPRPFHLELQLARDAPAAPPAPGAPDEPWLRLSVAGHALFGPDKTAPDHERLLRSLPPSVAATGWGVDLHLYSL